MSKYGSRQFEVQTPHWSVPFRLGGVNGAAFVNEQDSDDDVTDCIKVIIAYPVGFREDLPDFGVPDLLFRQMGMNIASHLWSSISRWEPRADLDVQAHTDAIDNLVQQVTLTARGSSNG